MLIQDGDALSDHCLTPSPPLSLSLSLSLCRYGFETPTIFGFGDDGGSDFSDSDESSDNELNQIDNSIAHRTERPGAPTPENQNQTQADFLPPGFI